MSWKKTKASKESSSQKRAGRQERDDGSEDDIDAFNAQREKIYLDESEGEPDLADEDEEAVMDLPSSSLEEDEEKDDDDDDEEADDWGRNKKTFYSADAADDDLLEEAEEARKLQKRQLRELRAEDFGLAKTGKMRSGPVTMSFSDPDSDADADSDSELEGEASDRYASDTELRELDGETLEHLLPAEEQLALVQKHAPETKKFLEEFQSKAREIRESVEPLLRRLRSSVTEDKGLSFLETKYQLLIGYCANLAYYLLLKVKGKNVERHPAVERLVKYRLLIEKMKPMEAKLQYQIDKLLRAASSTAAGYDPAREDEDEKALAFRPNLEMIDASGTEGSDNDDDDDGGRVGDSQLYRAPKMAPVHFADKVDRKEDRYEERERMLASRSRLLADIQADREECPEEESIDPAYGRSTVGRTANKEREAYEEENLVRFTLSKKEQRKLEKMQAKPIDELDDLNDFFREMDKEKTQSNGKGDLDRLLGTKTRRVKATGGDDDVPAKRSKHQKPSQKVLIGRGDEHSSEMSEIEDDVALHDQEDDLYKRAKSRSDAKKHFNANKPVNYRPIRDARPGEDRPANYEMMKNRGLTPTRPKEVRNPRVRQRNKWERAQKKIKSFKAVASTPARAYSGETSGIRTNVSRSVKF